MNYRSAYSWISIPDTTGGYDNPQVLGVLDYSISSCKSVTIALVIELQLASEIDLHPEIPVKGSC
jgi:hypothetical protein